MKIYLAFSGGFRLMFCLILIIAVLNHQLRGEYGARGCTRFIFFTGSKVHLYEYVVNKNPPHVTESSEPGGIPTRSLFSEIEKRVEEKMKKPSIMAIVFQNHHTVVAYMFSIVPELSLQYETKKGGMKPYPLENLMQIMSIKNIAFTFLFRSSDQETCPGCMTHP
jgi:hypothetical protein